jgi:hypothetical protein
VGDSRIIIGDFVTGRNILDLETVTHNWSSPRNRADDIICVVDLADPQMRALGLRNAATPNKTYIAKLIGDNVMAFGILRNPRYNKARRTLELRAEGIEEYLRKRFIYPAAALSTPLIDATTGEPNPLTATVLSGWDLGTIMKKVLQQSMALPGGSLPIVFQDDRVGTHEDTIDAASLTSITTLFENYASRENGPDWEFFPRLTADRLGIELLLRTGTETQPRLQSMTVHQFDYSVPEPSVDDLIADIDGDEMTGRAWITGGRTTGEALVTFANNTSLTDAGYPLLESVDTDHSSASELATLLSHSMERIRVSAAPAESWPFRVRTDVAPFPGEYGVGDRCIVYVRDDDFMPDGPYTREIASLGGDEDPDWITVTTEAVPLG